jgi:hypothetical protein
MSSIKTLQDILLSVGQDTEEDLSFELDKYIIPVHKFSLGYARRKRQIIHGRKEHRPVISFRRHILVPLIIILTIMTCAMSVPAIREPVVTFVVHAYNKMTDFIIRSDSHKQPQNAEGNDFTLNYIPKGFKLIDTNEIPTEKTEFYQDGKGQDFSFTLRYYEQGVNFSMDTENAVVTNTKIKGHKAVIAEKDTGVNIAVFDNKGQRIWNLIGLIDPDEALKIIQNVEIK